MCVTTWEATRYKDAKNTTLRIYRNNSVDCLIIFFRVSDWNCCLSLSLLQYFEFSSQKELRHNIGKQLCLEASGRGEPVKLEQCQRKGKGTSLAPSQEWTITEVSSQVKEKH